MPALFYQVVWQRALFSLYGTNIESITLIVADFMLGLGLGALLGSQLTAARRISPLRCYAYLEIITAIFGLSSLTIIHQLGLITLSYSLAYTSLLVFLLLLIPTACMGASLPLLIEYLQQRHPALGQNTASLYSANTFGAAVACLILAYALMSLLGQQKTTWIAATLNLITGISAWLICRLQPHLPPTSSPLKQGSCTGKRRWLLLSLTLGFCSLSYEMVWLHLLAFASGTRAPFITATLAFYLVGIAYGSLICHRLLKTKTQKNYLFSFLFLTLISSTLVIPALTWLHKIDLGQTHPLFSLLWISLGSIGFGLLLPYLAHLIEHQSPQSGRAVGQLYFFNIIGATLGTLLTGFYLMNVLSTVTIAWLLFSILLTLCIWAYLQHVKHLYNIKTLSLSLCIVTIAVVLPTHSTAIYQALLRFNHHQTPNIKYLEESNAGTIAVLDNGAVFGNGAYDGYFNIDPFNDNNGIQRAYLIPLFNTQPKRVLMIGLSSGSWAQVIANNPQVRQLDIVEINPSYLKLYKHYPDIQSLLKNQKAKIYIDDGRRWLNKHPDKQYDLIVMNTTWHWRDFSSLLLSQEMLALIKKHLRHGGQVYYNTTFSTRAIKTALNNFQYVIGVSDFIVASEQRIVLKPNHLSRILKAYAINGKKVFPSNKKGRQFIEQMANLPQILQKIPHIQLAQPGIIQPSTLPLLTSQQTLKRLTRRETSITDNNMGDEWRPTAF